MHHPILRQDLIKIHYFSEALLLLIGAELAWLACWKVFCEKISFHTVCCTPATSSGLLGCRSPHSLMALTVFTTIFLASPPTSFLGFFCSISRSKTALVTTTETTLAKASQIETIAVCISVPRSALLTDAEATIWAAVAFDEDAEAAWKTAQLLDQAGCASLQFAHLAFSLLLPWKCEHSRWKWSPEHHTQARCPLHCALVWSGFHFWHLKHWLMALPVSLCPFSRASTHLWRWKPRKTPSLKVQISDFFKCPLADQPIDLMKYLASGWQF